jgi:hypothetical protein
MTSYYPVYSDLERIKISVFIHLSDGILWFKSRINTFALLLLWDQPSVGSEMNPLNWAQRLLYFAARSGLSHTSWGGDRWVWSSGRMMISGGKPKNSEKTCSSAISYLYSNSVKCVLLKTVHRIITLFVLEFIHRLKMAVFWVVAPCSLVEVYQRFRGPCCLHHQGDRPDDGGSVAPCSLVEVYQRFRQPLHTHRRENLKSYLYTVCFFKALEY